MTISSVDLKNINDRLYAYLADDNGDFNLKAKEFIDLSLKRVVLNDLKKLNVNHMSVVNHYLSQLQSEQVMHITDWLMSAAINNDTWLSNTDDLGRPKKLMKFNSVEQIVQEADKAMVIAAQKNSKQQLNNDQEKTVSELDDGYSVVQLLTPESLDRESAYMQHCIGQGGYDSRVTSNQYKYLSLRDPANKPHVTIEAKYNQDTAKFDLFQIQGKQNKVPIEKYTNYLLPFLENERFGINKILENKFPYIIDKYDSWHNIYTLPDILECDIFNPLERSSKKIAIKMPSEKLITSKCVLDMKRTDGFPKELITSGTNVKEPISFTSVDFNNMPDHVDIKGNTSFHSVFFQHQPNSISIDGNLTITVRYGSPFFKSIDVTGDLMMASLIFEEFDCKIKAKDVVFWSCHLDEIKTDFILEGNLKIMESPKIKVLSGQIDVKNLLLLNTGITSLPDGCKVSESITLIDGIDFEDFPNTIVDNVKLIWKTKIGPTYETIENGINTVGDWREKNQPQMKM